MTFWGTTGAGDRILLGEPALVLLSRDRDAPADLLRLKFPADSLWQELEEVEILEHGERLFQGMVDEQNTSLTSSGLTVELVCRSMEALLLDNEAAPGVMESPSLELLEQRLLGPLGLALGKGDREPKRGRLTVNKGESCWTALEKFCGTFLGVEPVLGTDGLVHCGGTRPETVELNRVLSAQVELAPCKRIGQVWQQSYRGSYDTLFRNPLGEVRRRRYLSRESGKSPAQVLAEGERDSFSLTVTCAGAWWLPKGGRASVTLPRAGRFEDCPVKSLLYRRDSSGQRTRLTLGRPEGAEKGDSLCG